MIRPIGIVLALVAGTATAGELMDCYNDDIDVETRYTSNDADVLRVSDADISAMLDRIREHERRLVASSAGEPPLRVSLSSDTPASD